ncbi:MAG: hypothetical protein P0Y51_23275 [Candidatus Pseudomonas colombiensis]|uniref:Uncharacterized protein n=1 Tax=Pseudomonas morbosilactucae TaxID=2938197 RepID=A0ABT0JG94_9PSED|nr:hypothetical protein [Pseudomonas morbosilactucae]MCK9814928.1 hypothetical protein [Pseudomonas morbosilactucae]WEK08099.1 MAG: hypothetical protein P0Y51_23275 [Pseudomonas sp.]
METSSAFLLLLKRIDLWLAASNGDLAWGGSCGVQRQGVGVKPTALALAPRTWHGLLFCA